MASLNIKCSFSIAVRGKTHEGWQGTDAANDADDAFTLTVDGKAAPVEAQLATAGALNLWDEDSSPIGTFDYLFLVSDQDLDLQIIGSATHAVLRVKAGVPFCMGYDTILGVANTTEITAGATPAYESIDSIRVSNRSGSTANITFFVVD